jgi:3-hydroxyacyl-[acyl-carrier-protein] dehydratase
MNDKFLSLDVPQIQEYQQNRYPLLFIDAITKVIPGEIALGKKNFTYNEWYFPAHFDGDPSVPGFVQIECLVQVFIMTFLTLDEHKGKKTNFIALNNVKFRRKIVPGDTMEITAELKSFKRGLAIGSATGRVDGEEAISAEFVVALPDVIATFNPVKSNN